MGKEDPSRLTRPEQERAYLLKQAVKEALAENQVGAKAAIKEAITEWLNERYAQFGRWSLLGISAAALGVLAYFLLVSKGWAPPK